MFRKWNMGYEKELKKKIKCKQVIYCFGGNFKRHITPWNNKKNKPQTTLLRMWTCIRLEIWRTNARIRKLYIWRLKSWWKDHLISWYLEQATHSNTGGRRKDGTNYNMTLLLKLQTKRLETTVHKFTELLKNTELPIANIASSNSPDNSASNACSMVRPDTFLYSSNMSFSWGKLSWAMILLKTSSSVPTFSSPKEQATLDNYVI